MFISKNPSNQLENNIKTYIFGALNGSATSGLKYNVIRVPKTTDKVTALESNFFLSETITINSSQKSPGPVPNIGTGPGPNLIKAY